MTKSRFLLALVATLVFSIFSAVPGTSLAKDAPPATGMVTVYVSGHLGSSIAEALNKMHAKMEVEGWKFSSMAVHMENGDTKGMWVTYTK